MTWVEDPSPALLRHARATYEAAFLPDLRADFDSLFADEVLVRGEGDHDDRASGLVVLRRLGETGLVFVRYFVAGVRGAGVGSAMWHELRTRLGPSAQVVLDVEHPEEAGIDAEEAAVRRRRVVFYERLGLTVLPVVDYAPPHDDHAPPMLLLATEADGARTDEVRRLVLATFEHRYGLTDDDPRVRRVLEASGL